VAWLLRLIAAWLSHIDHVCLPACRHAAAPWGPPHGCEERTFPQHNLLLLAKFSPIFIYLFILQTEFIQCKKVDDDVVDWIALPIRPFIHSFIEGLGGVRITQGTKVILAVRSQIRCGVVPTRLVARKKRKLDSIQLNGKGKREEKFYVCLIYIIICV